MISFAITDNIWKLGSIFKDGSRPIGGMYCGFARIQPKFINYRFSKRLPNVFDFN